MLRIVIGLVLITYAVYGQNSWFYLGVIPLMMGMLDICPRKILSEYFSTNSCCEGDRCCSSNNISKEGNCCSVSSSDNKVKWSVTKEDRIEEGEMLIEILGTGCAKCVVLKNMVDETVKSLEGEFEVKKVEDIEKIMSYGVVSTPGFVINGEVKATGKALSQKEIIAFIEEARN